LALGHIVANGIETEGKRGKTHGGVEHTLPFGTDALLQCCTSNAADDYCTGVYYGSKHGQFW
jgi:hypothetical protein